MSNGPNVPNLSLSRAHLGGVLNVAVWANQDPEHGLSFSVKPTFRYRSEDEWKNAKNLPHRGGTLLVVAELLRQADSWCEAYRERHQPRPATKANGQTEAQSKEGSDHAARNEL